MKISDFIKVLEQVRNEQGDIEVMRYNENPDCYGEELEDEKEMYIKAKIYYSQATNIIVIY